ncbi:MAG: hypothetical protein MUF33_08455 [Candidatus Nanopelagicales bacterium]|jgi:hypothetical protein|nr:hypothetical protein [Candidatus Nanopelagicales bacterium]
MSTYDVTVSGPSPRMAMLATLIHKMAATGHTAWTAAGNLITSAARQGRTLAHTTLAIIGSPAGYHVALTGIRTAITSIWHGLKVTATWATRTGGKATGKAIGLIGMASPALALRLTRATTALSRPIVGAARTATVSVETAGGLIWMLATTDLVRTCTTRAALAAVTLIGIHAHTQGTLAARIVQALPWTMDAIITLTNPTRALAFVAGTMVIAMGVAAARLARQIRQPEPPTATAAAAAVPTAEDAQAEIVVLTDLAVIAGKVNLEVQRDGSVVVTGIPETVPPDLGQAVAEIALDAAMRQVRRTLPVRPVPSRDDRRLFTKAARDAIRAEAAQRKGHAA